MGMKKSKYELYVSMIGPRIITAEQKVGLDTNILKSMTESGKFRKYVMKRFRNAELFYAHIITLNMELPAVLRIKNKTKVEFEKALRKFEEIKQTLSLKPVELIEGSPSAIDICKVAKVILDERKYKKFENSPDPQIISDFVKFGINVAFTQDIAFAKVAGAFGMSMRRLKTKEELTKRQLTKGMTMYEINKTLRRFKKTSKKFQQ